uniref:Uncharacterized protein n=1 Tax=Brassica oleracea TaxID=3712 RepID=A0A3P6G057_BRAOL|nr:unnamed protein product [Brassica oleracea]
MNFTVEPSFFREAGGTFPPQKENGLFAVGQFRGGGRRDTRRMIHLFGSTSFFSPKTQNQWNVCP